MKKILLVATIYRVGERIYPIIPKLSEEFDIDVFKTAQMGNKISWYGDNDLRAIFDKKYKNYIKNTYYELPNLSDYDLIIFDYFRSFQPWSLDLRASCLVPSL